MTILVVTIIGLPSFPDELGPQNRLLTSKVLAAWRTGDVIVLVRHEERCDLSPRPCFGPLDGLTIAGTESAVAIGKAFLSLGMQSTDVLTSPSTRTEQTAKFMFGSVELLPKRLSVCGRTMGQEISTIKRPGRNLVLVTHSSCIRQFERAQGFPHPLKAKYGSALFIQALSKDEFKVLGNMDAKSWPAALLLK